MFLLETIFPGFVTNNFSLNYFLIPVLVFGALTIIFPEAEEEMVPEKPASKLDLVWMVALSVGSSFLIFYKFSIDKLILKLVISILSGFLVLLLGTVLFYFPDDLEEWKIKNLLPGRAVNSKKRKIISISAAAVFVVILVIFIPKFIARLKGTPVGESAVTPVVTLPKADPKLKVTVYNGGTETGEAARYAGLFKKEGYVDVTASNYPVNSIDNALIQFKESDSAQADLIENILRSDYSIVDRLPLATTSGEIRVILGAKPAPVNNAPDFENENVDFFFK